jgi:septal ring factor EnvC (AmiA/AmiB activator)
LVAAGLAVGLAAAPAPAQDRDGGSPTDLERQAEQDRERAKELRKKAADVRQEVRALRSESVAVAKRAQALERKLSELESTLSALKDREAAKLAALQDRRDQLAETLAALQRIAIQPPEALAMSSRSPLDVLRGAMVLGETVPAIEQRAQRLRGELVELRDLRDKIGTKRATLQNTKDKLASKRDRLAKVVARKKQLRNKLVGQSKAAAQRAAQMADRAESMRDLVARLRAQPDQRDDAAASPGTRAPAERADPGDDAGDAPARPADVPPPPEPKPANLGARATGSAPATPADGREPADAGRTTGQDGGRAPGTGTQTAKLTRPEDIRAFPDSRQSLRMPASGDVVTEYGEKITRAGGTTAAKGIVIKARHGARVVAPYDGKVAYAGPFKGYGRILIIEHGNRYHSLLAGLDRIDAVVGQWVLAGEPVGVMSEAPARTPELYMELRRTGRPINPLPWLAQTGNKVKG